MNNTMTLELGGQDRVLQFGKMGFLTYIQEASGMDPFDWFNSLVPKEGDRKPTIQSIKDVAIVCYAGINTALDMKDLDNISFEKVSKWVNGLDQEKMSEVINVAFASFTAEKNGEPTEEKKKELATTS